MRIAIVAVAVALAACGQGGPLGAASSGWQVQEVRDELTGTATQTATLVSPFDNGQVEMTATCKGEQILLAYDEWNEVGPVGGTGRVVEFRMTIIPANADDTFSLANAGTQLGLQSTVPLRASVEEGHEERLVGFVDHVNSVTAQVPVSAFLEAMPCRHCELRFRCFCNRQRAISLQWPRMSWSICCRRMKAFGPS